MQEEIKKVYERWKNALIKIDLVALEKLHTDNFTWTNNTGITCNKPEYLFRIRSGNVRYVSWINKGIKIDIKYGNAILKAAEILNMFVYEQNVNTARHITATFQLHNGNWLLSKIEERKPVA